MRIISLFSGVGGLDLGFTNVGFKLAFANDNDKDVWETFERNHKIKMDKRSIINIPSEEIPNAVGIIGGPPCQSWSLAGAMRGINDPRGKAFYEYLRILKDKRPLFFLAENVPGLVSKVHIKEFERLIEKFKNVDGVGYKVKWAVLNAKDFGAPQDRKRVIVVGYRKDLNKKFGFDNLKRQEPIILKEAIGNLPNPKPAKEKNKPNKNLDVPNHEYMNGKFSPIYMSRNRKRGWDEQSFTIQAGGRHAPLHPTSTDMVKVDKDLWEFKDGENSKHRRLSVRECAEIQTFPPSFIFYYNNVAKGYKMVGNAVPVKLAETLASQIKEDLKGLLEAKGN